VVVSVPRGASTIADALGRRLRRHDAHVGEVISGSVASSTSAPRIEQLDEPCQ